MRKIFSTILFALVSFGIFANIAFATTVPTIPKPDYLPGPTEATTNSGQDTQNYFLNTSIPKIINAGIGIIGIGAFVGLIFGAVNMLTAYGVEDKYKKGREIIQYSLMGLFIVIISYAIVSIISSISLPSSTTSFVPTAFAVNENDLDTLFPTEKDLIEANPNNEVSVAGGDLLTEVVPGIITNVFYLTGLLIFISLTVGGIYMVIGQGNEEANKKAKYIIIYSLVAMAVLSLGYAIVYGIATITLGNDKSSTTDNVFPDSTTQ